jgi:hypothetical protein
MLRRLTTELGFGLASFTLLVAVGLALWVPDAGKSPDTVNSALGAALLGGAVVALIVFITGRAGRIQDARDALAQSLVARFTTPKFFESLNAAAAVLREIGGAARPTADVWVQLPASTRDQLLEPLNALELIGTAYVTKEADRAILDRHFHAVAEAMWEQAEPLVGWLRFKAADPRLFENWQKMIELFRAPPHRKRPETYELTTAVSDADP